MAAEASDVALFDAVPCVPVVAFDGRDEHVLQLIYAKDMAQSFVDAAIAGLNRDQAGAPAAVVYNSPTRQLLTMREILAIVRDKTGNDRVSIAEGPFAPEIQMPTMSTADAFEALGCRQRFPLAEAIDDMARELSRGTAVVP